MSPAALPTRKLGREGPEVTAIGFGAMGLSAFYGQYASDEERLKVFDRAYELGETNWDTAAVYGDSELLIGKWFQKTGKRNEIFLATKFTYPDGTDKPVTANYEENKKFVFEAADKALSRLGIETIDLFYLHRMSSLVPIEHTMLAYLELKKAGKVRYFGLSECTADTLRRACRVAHVAAVQMEYSPYALDIEDPKVGVLEACKELGVAVVAYSPLGRGLFAKRFKSIQELEDSDWRKNVPKFQGDNMIKNMKLVEKFEEVAKRKGEGVTAGQVTLAWLLAQWDGVIPIPGTRQIKYLEENVAAMHLKLSDDELTELRGYINEVGDVGHRGPVDSQATLLMDAKAIDEEEAKQIIEKAKALQ